MEQRNSSDPITPIPESIQYHQSQYDHSMFYETTAGQRKEMAVEHLPGSDRKVTFATFAPGAEEPSALVELDMEEARLRYKFLSSCQQMGLLDLS